MSPKLRAFLVTTCMAPVWIGAVVFFMSAFIMDESIHYNLPWIMEHPWKMFFHVFISIIILPSWISLIRVPLNIWYWQGSSYSKLPKGIKAEYISILMLLKNVYDFERERELRFAEQVMEE